MSEFREILITERKRQGLTMEKLAQLAGVSQNAIAAYEKGTMPSLAKADAILTALGRSMTIGDDTKTETMTVRVMLKNGKEFAVKCRSFGVDTNIWGAVTGYEIDGITENKPIYLDFSEVAACVRVMSDEGDNT